jgi:hypothetical protein
MSLLAANAVTQGASRVQARAMEAKRRDLRVRVLIDALVIF